MMIYLETRRLPGYGTEEGADLNTDGNYGSKKGHRENLEEVVNPKCKKGKLRTEKRVGKQM